MKKDYVALWNALSESEQQQQQAEQSRLYRRATALINKEDIQHGIESQEVSTEESPQEPEA